MDEECINLEFKTPNGITINLKDIYEDESIEAIKQKLQDQSGIPIEQMRLIFKGKKLEDHKSISDSQLKNKDQVRLVVAVR